MNFGVQDIRDIIYNNAKRAGFKGGMPYGKFAKDTADLIYEMITNKEPDMRNKEWDDWHGFPDELKLIVTRLEKFLNLRNMMRDERAVEVYQWVADQEKAGKTIAKFAEWALQPERAQFVGKYKKTPEAIKTDWQLAFSPTETKKGGYDEVRF